MGRGDRNLPETASAAGSTGAGESPEAPRSPESGPPAEIRPGDCLGRYTVRGLVGAGGMGRVFAAVDPELGRTVALKLIRPDRSAPPRARARLLREAQALARLHHPNVVTVYDVGTQGDEVFMAMELIEGTTLAGWLRAARRTWREVLVTFLAAGRGLAAAHAAGIVHRDFKPENVIVGQDRVVVVDFGLARAGAEEAAEPEAGAGTAEESELLQLSLTLTGEHVGTPLYMAPEQRAGGVVTPRADQFSFCVALWQALHGEPTSGGQAVAEPRRAEVPGWVASAVLRGQARDLDARWPSMDELLQELARDPARNRRRILVAAAVAALAGTAVFGIARSRAADPCAGAAARLAGVWDAPRKEAVHRAFAATRIAYADDAWRRVSARIDEYAAGWADMHAETCRATRLEGRQSDMLMDLRMACLDRRRAVLGALGELWARGMDGETLEAATEAARGLAPLAECADARALTERAPLPADPAAVARIAGTRTHLDAVQALTLAHRWSEAKTAAAKVRAEAEATGWPQVQAESAFAEGDVLHNLSDPSAEKPLLEAARLAGLARDDRLAARALIELVKNLAADDQNAGRALLVADIAEGAVARAGNDVALRARLQSHRADALLIAAQYDAARAAFTQARALAATAFGAGDSETLWNVTELARVADLQGNYAEARRLGEQNLAATVAALGPEHPRVASTLTFLGLAVANTGDSDTAARYLRQALALKEKIAGPDAAWNATTLNNLANVELARGNLHEAETLHERALAIRQRVFGKEHAFVGNSLGNLSDVRRKQGRYDEALDLISRSLAINKKAFGPSHPTIANQLGAIGDILDGKGDLAGALASYRRALDIRNQALGAHHPETLHTMNLVAGQLAALHRCGEARPLVATALAGLEKALGPDHDYVGEALWESARCELAAGQAAPAVAHLERAIAIAEKSAATIDRGTYRWLLARALWSLGRRDAARAAAEKAEQELAGDADGSRDRAAARAWLAAHR